MLFCCYLAIRKGQGRSRRQSANDAARHDSPPGVADHVDADRTSSMFFHSIFNGRLLLQQLIPILVNQVAQDLLPFPLGGHYRTTDLEQVTYLTAVCVAVMFVLHLSIHSTITTSTATSAAQHRSQHFLKRIISKASTNFTADADHSCDLYSSNQSRISHTLPQDQSSINFSSDQLSEIHSDRDYTTRGQQEEDPNSSCVLTPSSNGEETAPVKILTQKTGNNVKVNGTRPSTTSGTHGGFASNRNNTNLQNQVAAAENKSLPSPAKKPSAIEDHANRWQWHLHKSSPSRKTLAPPPPALVVPRELSATRRQSQTGQGTSVLVSPRVLCKNK
ncbi:unnamed protein product [Amoebophrya sp. A120]|nr:unnamed protein product [Amoebophrya sp. A120]|eukprot:GSA120T00023659001.1